MFQLCSQPHGLSLFSFNEGGAKNKCEILIGSRLGHAELDHELDGAPEHGEQPEVAESSLVPLPRVSGL